MTVSLAAAALIDGWMSHDEMVWLQQQAALLPVGGRWVEIGTWKGRSFAAVASGLPDGCYLTAVDHWCGSPETGHDEAREPGKKVLRAFLDTLATLVEQRPEVLFEVCIGHSVDFSLPADVVFIDGTHDEASVVEDVNHWRECLNAGGMLCGHDYRDYPQIRSALQKCGIAAETGPDSIWYARM